MAYQVKQMGPDYGVFDGDNMVGRNTFTLKENAENFALMLEALENFENDDGHIPVTIWELRNKAIRAAKGEKE